MILLPSMCDVCVCRCRMRLLVHSARQVVQVCSEGQRVLRGADMDRLAVLTVDGDSAGLAVAVDRSERGLEGGD